MAFEKKALNPQFNSMKFRPPSKRNKLNPSQSSSLPHSTTTTTTNEAWTLLQKRDAAVMALISKPTVHEAQNNSANLKIRQARDAAVAQAQHEGCKGNYRIFDSPYGNFLVPVIPTKAELGG